MGAPTIKRCRLATVFATSEVRQLKLESQLQLISQLKAEIGVLKATQQAPSVTSPTTVSATHPMVDESATRLPGLLDTVMGNINQLQQLRQQRLDRRAVRKKEQRLALS